jgi:uncharacterized membrane protein YraQ (UPF0718 family)
MGEFIKEVFMFITATANHTFLMMYWVWLPAFLLSGYLFTRWHRDPVDKILQDRNLTLRSLFQAIKLGASYSTDRHKGLAVVANLFGKGTVPFPLIFAFWLASQHLILYSLSFFMALVGGEFFVGPAVAALTMISLTTLFLSRIPENTWEEARKRLSIPSPSILLSQSFGRGPIRDEGNPLPQNWKGYFRYIGREIRAIWKNVILGIILAGFIATIGRTEWWIDFSTVGGGGVFTEILNVFLGATISLVIPLSPVGHLFVAAFLWKTYTLTYGGILGFFLASTLDLRNLWVYGKILGARLGLMVEVLGFASAILGALVVVVLLRIVGFEVTHVPLFHEYVDKIMMFFSLGGKMM